MSACPSHRLAQPLRCVALHLIVIRPPELTGANVMVSASTVRFGVDSSHCVPARHCYFLFGLFTTAQRTARAPLERRIPRYLEKNRPTGNQISP